MKIAICDTDLKICEYVKSKIQQEFLRKSSAFQIDTYTNGFSLIEGVTQSADYDICFLNASMSGLNGIELANEIKRYRENCLLVLYSLSDQYALAAWNVDAFFYLMLPPTKKDVIKIIGKAQRYLQERDGRYLRLKMKDGWYHVLYRSILYLESNAHKVVIYLTNGNSMETYGKLDRFEEVLCEKGQFIRIHKSVLLHGIYISKFSTAEVGIINGALFNVSRAFQDKAREQYDEYIKNNRFITM